MRHLPFNAALGATLAISLALPGLVSAAGVGVGAGADLKVGNAASAHVTATATVNFCTSLSTFSATMNERLTAAKNRLDARQQWIYTTASNRRDEHMLALTDARTKQDQDRAGVYAKLNAKATTDGQKQAVVSFQTSINAATTLRRNDVDAAIAAYWQGVANALNARKTSTMKAEQDLSTALQASLSTATSECSSNTSPTTARQHFAASVKTDLSAFATARKDIDKAGPEIKTLAQTRNAAILKATSDFKASAEKANADLKASWSASASS